MGRGIVSSSNFGNTSVSSHDHDRRLITLKGSVEERETFNIEHMNFVNEKHSRYNFSSTFFSPFSNLLVNLLSNLGLNFSDISSEKGHESLRAGVDDIDFVKGHSVDDFLSLLEFTFGALDKASLRSNVIIVR